jgi:hypothetical protein
LKEHQTVFDWQIHEIIIVGTATSTQSAPFHFCLALVNQAGPQAVHCVHLDMIPTYTDLAHPMRGMLMVEYKHYASSHSPGMAPFSIAVNSETHATAGGICHLLINEKQMDKYK